MKNKLYNDQYWLESSLIPTLMKEEYLASPTKEQAFRQELTFGTGGMRGIMGLGPSYINNIMIIRVTLAYAKYLLELSCNPTIVIGYDNRHYSKEFAQQAALALSSLNIKVLLFDEIMATPLVSYAIRYYHASGGIIITASHNAKEYNGYKLYDDTGSQLLPPAIKAIKMQLNQVNNLSFKPNKQLITILDQSIINKYLETLFNCTKISSNKTSFMYSAQHGTGFIPMQALIKKFNLTNGIILEEQSYQDPSFTNTLSANPEDLNAYTLLIEKGLLQRAHYLLTTDPDCDRLGVAYLHQNKYHLLSGNQLGLLLLDYLIKTSPLLPNTYVVSTIVSSPLAQVMANKHQINYYEVLTGFKYIGATINKYHEEDFLFGFEESYGYLIKPITRDKDAIQTMLIFLEMASYYSNNNLSLNDVLKQIYHEYGYYLDKLITIPINNNQYTINELYQRLKQFPYHDLKTTIDYEDNNLNNLEPAQVFKVIFNDGSTICFRPSGTEALIKIYLSINDQKQEIANLKLKEYEKLINIIIKGEDNE
ncbi:MAG: phospho-sugar mutase [Bacilli bacterium]